MDIEQILFLLICEFLLGLLLIGLFRLDRFLNLNHSVGSLGKQPGYLPLKFIDGNHEFRDHIPYLQPLSLRIAFTGGESDVLELGTNLDDPHHFSDIYDHVLASGKTVQLEESERLVEYEHGLVEYISIRQSGAKRVENLYLFLLIF